MSLSDKIAIGAALLAFSGFTIKGSIVYFKTKQDKMKAVLDNKYVLGFGIATICLLIVCIIVLIGNNFNFGIDNKIVKVVHDTIKIKDSPIPTNKQVDTNHKPKPKIVRNHHEVSSIGTIKIPEKSAKSDTNYKAKNLVTAPNYGNQQVGDNNTQNNIGKIDHHPEMADINAIMYYLHDKNKKIVLMYETPDSDSRNYCDELKSILEKYGYQQVELFGHLNVGFSPQPKKVVIDTSNYRISVEWNYN
jgi:hypothetical protein